MGRSRRKGRAVNGILLLDKPAGCSSNHALQQARRLLDARKAGHTGTLDPFATGLLPLVFGEATKFSRFMLDSSKAYRAVAELGRATTTGDVEGETRQQQAVPKLDPQSVEQALEQFRGDIQQIPPMYSALKQQGKRLYELARQGVEVEREPRDVCIHSLELVDQGADWLELQVYCSKGTYIRTLVEDLAEALGTVACTRSLRRTRVGGFDLDQAVTLEQLEATDDREGLLLPLDAGLQDLPAMTLEAVSAQTMVHGQPVSVALEDAEAIRLYDPKGVFIGVGRSRNGTLTAQRLVASR